jgi:two-component system sensor kinase FixL
VLPAPRKACKRGRAILPVTSPPPSSAASGETRRAASLAEELGLLIDGATNYAIYMLDTQGHVTIWNRGAERIKGWSEAEIVGRHVSIFYPPDEVAAGKPAGDLARASATGRVEEESWRLRKDGSEFLASVTITALRDEAGALRGFGKVIRDITDERAAETALARREEHLRSILETVPDAMIVIDEVGTVTSYSAAAERLFGHAQADVIGANVSMLMPGAERDRHNGYLGRYLATGETHIIGNPRPVTGLRANGETFPLELAVGEAISGGQRIFTGFIRDLTERQRTALKMQELQSELIHVSRLSAMGTMASTLAHELNQPLTAITNYLETTRDLLSDLDPATLALVRDALGEAAGQSLRAGQIVRRLREFVARGDVEQRPEPLATLVREAATLGLIGAAEADVVVTIALHDEAAIVLVDRVQIQQVLVNLLRNALQAMRHGTPRELGITTVPESKGCIQISVSDTGGGIAPAMHDRLFQAFATTKDDGMGLGLSICRTIIEAHGGRIWASAGATCGTTFHFTVRSAEPVDADDG